MRKLTALCFVLIGCSSADDSLSSRESEVAGSDRLDAGESLYPGQSISSGGTWLAYQGDGNLVLYQSGNAIWASMAGLGAPTDRFEMQSDCNAVVYSADGYVWASGTSGQGSGCSARVVEGDWFICNGDQRVFSARGGGDCGGGGGIGPWTGGGGLEVMPRIGGAGDPVTAYYVHALQNTEITVGGVTRTFWDMIDHGKFKVGLGTNGGGTDSFRLFFHYTGEGHWMIANAQHHGWVRYRNSNDGSYTHWFGFTQGGIFDPTANHPDMDHSYKSLFEESGKGLCIQPQWNDGSTVGELDIDFHRQAEVIDHNRPDNSDPLTTCSGGCKNNNAYFHAAWGNPGGLPGYAGPMTVSEYRGGPVYNFHSQRNMSGFMELARVLGGRGIGVVTGQAVPR
ncbi:MAG: hypothetical protein M4D80_23960 [Myxococcota bacterium]|nr:hypothetical protein [Deltaproteobacteria bacterium]MDQ3338232.1 hypothetical protein [Myxococcota bacterium]